MKRLFFVFIMFVYITHSFAQTSVGSFVRFPNNKLFGRLYKPSLTFIKSEEKMDLILTYVRSDGYASFDENSQILFKFEDGSIEKLPTWKPFATKNSYDSMWQSVTKTYAHFYITNIGFDIDPEIINKIVKDNVKITKIRILFSNGDFKDWEISKSYQKKLIKGLTKSYNEALIENKTRKSLLDNSEKDF